MRIGPLPLGIVVTLIGCFAVWQAAGFVTRSGLAYGPGLFPTLLGFGLIGAGLLLGSSHFAGRSTPGEVHVLTASGVLRISGIIAAILFYILCSRWIGFMPTIFVVVATMALMFGAHWLAALATGIFSAGFLFVVFGMLLRVPLPYGPLELLVV